MGGEWGVICDSMLSRELIAESITHPCFFGHREPDSLSLVTWRGPQSD